jgi:16S rRNA (uracil1498-N3)-methyltransferase
MHVFFKPDIQGSELLLDENESFHCIRVLRLKQGDTVYLIDGIGGFYHARITDANPKKCHVVVYTEIKDYGKRDYSLTIAIAPTKNIDRFEWFLEKACEIGIDRIIPIVCQQSERKVIKSERLNKIIIEAIKQSQQAFIPVLDNLITFKQLMNKELPVQKCIAYCNDDKRLFLKNILRPKDPTIILIGPEGDFSPEEIKTAFNKGFQGVSLGKNRLRTETAGVVACDTVAIINQ